MLQIFTKRKFVLLGIFKSFYTFLIDVVNAESGINKWLTLGENVVYDSKSNNITVDNERYYRAVVTNK